MSWDDSTLRQVAADAQLLKNLDAETKNAVLLTAARLIRTQAGDLLAANATDLRNFDREAAQPNPSPKYTSALRDRLVLTPERLEGLHDSLIATAALTDPVGEEVEARRIDNGMLLRRVRAPLGVIFMIFESRPNVAIESFAMAFKSGNAIILRGGTESIESCRAIYSLLREALTSNGLPSTLFWGIENPDRAIVKELLLRDKLIDLVVPRGGEALIRFVTESTRIPIIKNDRGLCHTYVHADADLDMAVAIVRNAKTQRPGVCNSLETVLVHSSRAVDFLPALYEATNVFGLEWFACERSREILYGHARVQAAQAVNWDTEYLAQKINCRVVDSLDEAFAHIRAHGSRHSECIVTEDEATARRFQHDVDAAAVYWNASTRFTDGFEFGLGGELGISTQKLHVRGPVGLRELTSARWVIDGTGQIRK